MGYFIGIELSPENKALSLTIQEKLRSEFPEVTWLSDAQLFCVISYLPIQEQSSDKQQPTLAKSPGVDRSTAERIAKEIGENIAPFTMTLGGTGCFPANGTARVAWVGVKELNSAHGMLSRLLSETRRILSRHVATKNDLVPHVPVGRASDRAPKKDLRRALGQLRIDGVPQQVTRIIIVESLQSHQGVAYQVVGSSELSAQVWG